ncbi:hypothetical protein NL676_029981 [Syzygium grande]|nr:hypothetical protein NL676_029981 [Syzygium grande]
MGQRENLWKIPELEDAYAAGGRNSDKYTLILTDGDSGKYLAVSAGTFWMCDIESFLISWLNILKELANQTELMQMVGLSIVGRDHYGVFPLKAYYEGKEAVVNNIIGMADDCVGANNINLLMLDVKVGTHNILSPITRFLLHKDYDNLLNYLNDNGESIEPTWYKPVLPMVFVKGSEGFGTGYSSYIPNYNPRDIIANLRPLLNGEMMEPMDPCSTGVFPLKTRVYEKRKKILLENLALMCRILENKGRFIQGFIPGELIKRKRADVCQELQAKGFFTPSRKETKTIETAVAGSTNDSGDIEENKEASGYEYLLSMKTDTMTSEKAEEFQADAENLRM